MQLTRVSYLIIPNGHPVCGCILELVRIWQLYCTCISNIHKHIVKLSIFIREKSSGLFLDLSMMRFEFEYIIFQ
jgi:hypothetical protein